MPGSQKHRVFSPEYPFPGLESPLPPRHDNDSNQIPPTRDSQAISHVSPPTTSPSYEISSNRPEPHRPLRRPDFLSSDGNANKYNPKVVTPRSSSSVSGSSNQAVTLGVFSPSRGLTQRPYRSSPPSVPLLASAPSSSPSPSVEPVRMPESSKHVAVSRESPSPRQRSEPPDASSSGRSANDNREVAPESSSPTRSSASGSPKHTVTPESFSPSRELTRTPRRSLPLDSLSASTPSSSPVPSRMSLTSAASDDVCATRVMPSDEQPNGDSDAEGGIAPPSEQPHAGLAALNSVSDAPQDTVTSESSSLHQELTASELTSCSGDKNGGIALPGEQSHGVLAAEPSSVSDASRDTVTVTVESFSLHQEPSHPMLSYSGGIVLFDERRHTSPAAASYPSPIVTFAESESNGGSTNGIMWEMLR